MFTPRVKRWIGPALALLLSGVAAMLLLVGGTQAASPAQSGGPGATPNDVNRVAKQLYCPVCPNTPLNVCETQACKDWRELIRQKLSAGSSDQEIVDYFVAQYGQRVLAQPQARGFNLLVWLIPLAALLTGAGALTVVLRSWIRRRAGPSPTPAPEPSMLPEDYMARIERELQARR
jgi:cytochrome c-type biogenesis protein CcmH